jgi:2,4-dienoyl-CoA reductase (NADPH2)
VYANDCRDSIGGRRSLACMVNPDAGHELHPHPERSGQRRVVVVGGGIAGLEAAAAAADRGDEVILFERSSRLGGQLALAAAASRSELGRLVEHMVARVGKDVDVRLNQAADAAAIAALRPDVVVLACGAEEPSSRFPDAVTGWRVLNDPTLLAGAERVVLFDESGGNGWPLFTPAEVLAEAGHPVSVVIAGAAIGTSVEAASLPPLLRRLKADIHVTSTIDRVDADGVTVRNLYTGVTTRLDGARLVVEPGRRPLDGLRPELAARGVEAVLVGDALAPRRISVAIREARAAVREGVAVGADQS